MDALNGRDKRCHKPKTYHAIQTTPPRLKILTKGEKPLICTLFRANSHMSVEVSFHTCAAMLNSSINGSLVKWNCSGSSVLRLTCSPRHRKSCSGLRWYSRNNELLLNGDMAIPICVAQRVCACVWRNKATLTISRNGDEWHHAGRGYEVDHPIRGHCSYNG